MKSTRATAIDVAVGARIRNLRLRHKLSQTALGEQLNVTFQQIQKYEKGTNRVSAGNLAQLAKFFGVPVEAFYSEVRSTNAKPAKRNEIGASAADTNINRLVKAFQTLRDKTLKVKILQLAEEMVRHQRPNAVRCK
jgi:transcriptional regulator with XRE-family HTH domain